MQPDPADFHESPTRSDKPPAHQTVKQSATPARPDSAPETIVTLGAVLSTMPSPPPDFGVPRRFGNYDLLERLGKGGMGVVWKAKQIGTDRVVALKQVVAAEFGSAAAIERFKVEARAAAALDHPGIVPVYDIGEVGSRPYYTMPVVDGGSLRNRLADGPLAPSVTARLLVQLADAVQHAHGRGVIHRDLKPENVLLQSAGARSADGERRTAERSADDQSKVTDDSAATLTPRLTDFGLARAATADANGVTQVGALLGTPSYMAPEQASGDNALVGPLADVYGLGAVLYCCLTGRPPFQAASVLETLRQVREQEPVPVRQLNAAVPRDLETICLKCLEKDPRRRYPSAAELAADLQRYERGEPIRAVPAGPVTRLWKWAGRNRAVAGWLAAVAASLVAGILVASWQARIAGQERDVAEAARAEAKERADEAEAARAETKQRADELQQVADFQAQILRQVDPTEAGVQLAKDVKAKFTAALAKTAMPAPDRAKLVDAFVSGLGRVNVTDAARDLIDRTILKPAIEAIDKQFAGQPVVAASLRQELANRYGRLGLFNVALPLQEKALEARRRLLGDDHPDTVRSAAAMGELQQYRGKYPEAEQLFREVLAWRRRVLGPSHSDTLNAMTNLGDSLRAQAKYPEAEQFCRAALAESRRVPGEDELLVVACLDKLGDLLRDEGKLAEAEGCYQEALAVRRRKLGEDNPDTLQSVDNMGSLLNQEGKRAEAQQYFRESLERRRRTLGETHPLAIVALRNLATTLSLSGNRSEAEALYREALAAQQAALGSDHPDTMLTLNNLAVALIEQGKLAEAEPMCRELLARQQRVSGPTHPDTLLASNNLASLLRRQNKIAEAEVFVRQSLDIAQRTLGDDHPETLVYRHNLGVALREQHKPQEAEPYLRDVVTRGRRKLGPEHLTTLTAVTSLSSALVDQKRYQEAIDLLTPAEKSVRKVCKGSNARTLAVLLMNLGKARAATSQAFPAAEAQLLEAHKLFTASRGPRHKETIECTRALVDFYTAWNAYEPGAGHDAKAAEWQTKLDKISPPTGPATGGKS